VPVRTMWRRENVLPYRASNFDPSAVHPVAHRYTDYTIPAPFVNYTGIKNRSPVGTNTSRFYRVLPMVYNTELMGFWTSSIFRILNN
jgi:hypothetical protein